MVRAILDGTKTQTRRLVKSPGILINIRDSAHCCPYGLPGDRLWVRETFSGPRSREQEPPRLWHSLDEIHWWADGNPKHGDWTKPRPGIFMPRWASRITLEITEVRVQRLPEISQRDAMAEGVWTAGLARADDIFHSATGINLDHVSAYRKLWSEINGDQDWIDQRWVWAMTFRRLL